MNQNLIINILVKKIKRRMARAFNYIVNLIVMSDVVQLEKLVIRRC